MDVQARQTILQRLTGAGIADDRVRAYLASGWVRAGDEVLTDPDTVVAGSYVLAPPAVTDYGLPGPGRAG